MNTICMITIQYLMSEHSSDSISNRLSQRSSISQDSKATTTLINCVTEKAYRQISQSLGLTRNFYTTDSNSLSWRQDHINDIPTYTERSPHSFKTIKHMPKCPQGILHSIKTIEGNGTVEIPVHAERSLHSFKTINRP